jgi:hypothetical protein
LSSMGLSSLESLDFGCGLVSLKKILVIGVIKVKNLEE